MTRAASNKGTMQTLQTIMKPNQTGKEMAVINEKGEKLKPLMQRISSLPKI